MLNKLFMQEIEKARVVAAKCRPVDKSALPKKIPDYVDLRAA